MPGRPGSVAPMALQPGASRCTTYRRAGLTTSRCGSLAMIGMPVADLLPPMTQLLLPRSGSASQGLGLSVARTIASSSDTAPRPGPVPPEASAPSPGVRFHRMLLASRVRPRIAGSMSSRSRPGGTTIRFWGSVGFSSCSLARPVALMSRARCTSLAALRDRVQPGIRVSSVRAVHTGCGRNPMIWNSAGILFSSIAFWMDAFTPLANASKISRPSGWYFRNSSSQFPRNASSRAKWSRVT